ncbi:MAG TPA: MBOAT family protein [Sphingomonas sp.]
MLFTSGLFLFLFLPLTLALFYGLARLSGPRLAAAWLAFMSLAFYAYWMPVYLGLLLGSILLNYLGGIAIVRATDRERARLVTTAFVATDLLVLGFFKYYNFFTDNLRAVALPLPVLNVVLPIGISFFTFTQIAFLVDSYRGKARDARPIHYLLFVTYFPHLIAGPILHHSEMMPQFEERRTYRPDLARFATGFAFLLAGMIKKVLVADSISPIADRAFQAAGIGQVGVFHAWEGAIAYALQIYFDFSGYSDMAVGLSLLFNIQLPYNFASPYRSTSIVEFWRRWHMTLSRFLRDYLYIALGGNRHGNVRRYANLAATMLLGGLWHGAAWTFVIWGGLHGAFLVVNHGWRYIQGRIFSGAAGGGGRIGAVLGWLLTMLAVLIAWVFFRAASIAEAIAMLRAMAGHAPAVDFLAGRAIDWLPLAALGLFAAVLPNSQQVIMGRIAPAIERARASGGGTIWLALGIGLVLLVWLALVAASRENSAFIYFNF